jgi:hypothetical protein
MGSAKAAQTKAHHTSPAAKTRSINAAVRASRRTRLFWRPSEAEFRLLTEATVTDSIVRKFIKRLYFNVKG